jgi:hypothetical protein
MSDEYDEHGEADPDGLVITEAIDLDGFPLAARESPAYAALVARCRDDVRARGMFDLVGFVRPVAIARSLSTLRPLIEHESFEHRRTHNIYFLPTVEGLAPDHPALRQVETANRTVCADRLVGTLLTTVYEWAPLRRFIADVIQVGALFPMADDLARVNVMSYRAGEALNWHFDRSEFTTTLLLQRPTDGGTFEFRPALRTDHDPNYDGVVKLIAGTDPLVQRLDIEPGTLTVFAGRHTAHRVSPVVGELDRVVAVFSYVERPDVVFTEHERRGFYGRT